jgi:hypothetical protein
VRGDQVGHARARPEFDIVPFFEAAPTNPLERRPRQRELIEAEVALRKRIEARHLITEIQSNAHSSSASLDEIAIEAGKQRVERAKSAGEQPMRVPRLRRAGSRRGHIRQCVAIEHDDGFKIGRDGFRRGEASDPRADHDSSPGYYFWHSQLSRCTRCRPAQLPAEQRTVSASC